MPLRVDTAQLVDQSPPRSHLEACRHASMFSSIDGISAVVAGRGGAHTLDRSPAA